jgi:hypothetical protein
VKSIKSNGDNVEYGVDATKLCYARGTFDTILWNFPHIAGKQNIRKNRTLLQNFLLSAATVLDTDGCVKVALCEGQSGTNAGNVDDWNHSWKLVHQAAEAGLLLTQVEPFDSEAFEEFYSPQGHRGRGGRFYTGISEMYTLKPAEAKEAAAVQAPSYGM